MSDERAADYREVKERDGNFLRRWLFKNRVLVVLMVLAACVSQLWVAATPPWRAPDEPAHFGYLQYLDREQAIPLATRAYYYPDLFESKNRTNFMGVFGYPSTSMDLQTIEQNSAAGHPPLYYSLMYPAYELTGGNAVESRLYFMRIVGIAFFVALIGVAYRFAVLLFPKAPYFQAGIPLLMILHPQLAFVGSGVMNDTLLTLFFTLFLYQLAVFVIKDTSLRRALFIGIIMGLGTLTKISFVLAFPVGIVVFAALLAIRRDQRIMLMKAAGVTIGVSLAICGWYFVRNFAELGFLNPPGKVVLYNVDNWWDLWFATRFRAVMLGSFLGDFSWLTIPLYDNVLLWFRRLTELSAIGLLAALLLGLWRRRLEAIAPWIVTLFAGIFIAFFMAASQFELNTGGAQGRYLFPAVFPFWTLVLVGLTGWMPPSWRGRATAVVVSAAAVLSVWALMVEYLPRVS
ncbi:MAG: hypothetical protein WC828_02690 [Thermoleophilia bacterium]|jgi:4-amino-4-deoxy-L-arabinose transferase-like glycosyltransferase